MIQELYGITLKGSERESIFVGVSDDCITVNIKNINGCVFSTPYKKPVGISDEKINSDFANLLKLHNETVIDTITKLKRSTIQKVFDYYSEKTAEEQKEEYDNKQQKNIFDAPIGKKYGISENVRVLPNSMLLFENNDIPISFDISEEEYNLIEYCATKFLKTNKNK